MGIKNDNACSQAATKAGDNMIGKTNQSSPSPSCTPNQKTPSEKATPTSEQSENVGAIIARHKPLAWSILGLAFCRAGLIVGSYGSYSRFGSAVAPDRHHEMSPFASSRQKSRFRLDYSRGVFPHHDRRTGNWTARNERRW